MKTTSHTHDTGPGQRSYVYPTVRWLPGCTAHPHIEAITSVETVRDTPATVDISRERLAPGSVPSTPIEQIPWAA